MNLQNISKTGDQYVPNFHMNHVQIVNKTSNFKRTCFMIMLKQAELIAMPFDDQLILILSFCYTLICCAIYGRGPGYLP